MPIVLAFVWMLDTALRGTFLQCSSAGCTLMLFLCPAGRECVSPGLHLVASFWVSVEDPRSKFCLSGAV